VDPLNPLFAAICLAVALTVARLLPRTVSEDGRTARYDTIDGLRGYLAFLVFVHHAAIWYFYARTGAWRPPPSNFYNQLGSASVALFFMITGFLFFSRILQARGGAIDWLRLYVSRFLRLTPLYVVATLLAMLMVAVASSFDRHDSGAQLLGAVLAWSLFALPGMPDVNGVSMLPILSVAWTLAYEWLYYLALPLLAVLVGVRVPTIWLALGLAGCLSIYLEVPIARIFLVSFAGGMLAAVAVRHERTRGMLRSRVAAWGCAAALVVAYTLFPGSARLAPLALLSVGFLIIAAGNSMGGTLTTRVSRQFGEWGYSVYLLHLPILYAVFGLLIGIEGTAGLSPLEHWSVVAVCGAVTTLISSLGYRGIERPFMQATDRVSEYVRRKLEPSRGA
jgi:peptidoglycan/LPS O-acetylase OafA/YrhL